MTSAVRRVTLPLRAPDGSATTTTRPATSTVTAVVYEPRATTGGAAATGPVPVLLLPGAGGSLDSAPLVALAEMVAAAGFPVVRANLPHHERGARAPRAETSVPAVGRVLAAAREELGDGDRQDWVLGGRSYGSRVASMAVAGGLPAAGVLCSGYPLHPPGRPDRLRVAHWPDIGVPVLFVQGDADPMADLELLDQHRGKLPRRSTLVVVPGGDHTLRVTRTRSPDGIALDPAVALHQVAEEVATWLGGLEPVTDGTLGDLRDPEP